MVKNKKCRSSCFWNGIFLNLLTHGSRLRFSSISPDRRSESNLHSPAQRAELDWLLYNKPLEYAQMVLRGEMGRYLSLGCDHGRLED